MFGALHPVGVKKSFIGSANYRLSARYEKFLDFISDVKALRFSANNILIDSNSSPPNTDSTSTSALINRQMKNSGELGLDNADPLPFSPNFIDSRYPFFSGGGVAARFTLDFGRSLFNSSLLYPFLEIRGTNSLGLVGSTAVGGLDIDTFGSTVLFGLGGVNIQLSANASARIEERYSNLVPESLIAKAGANFIFRVVGKFSFLSLYDKIYLNGARLAAEFTDETIIVNIPPGEKSGYFYISSTALNDVFKTERIRFS